MDIDRQSPVELHAQITQELRYRISSGGLSPGTRLPSARKAATLWGVNFHTVRRVYRELAQLGLVEMNGSAGTRVVDASMRVGEGPDFGAFIDGLLARSAEDYGLTLDELVILLKNRGSAPARAPVTVVECNHSQAQELAIQIATRFRIDAYPFVLGSEQPPRSGVMLGTLFHRKEMIERWPERRNTMRFLPIQPDPLLAATLERSKDWHSRRRLLFASDTGTARAMAADVERLFVDPSITFKPRLLTPSGRIPRAAMTECILVSPVDWTKLPASQRNHRCVRRIPYQFDQYRLGAVAQSFGWQSRQDGQPSMTACPYQKAETGT